MYTLVRVPSSKGDEPPLLTSLQVRSKKFVSTTGYLAFAALAKWSKEELVLQLAALQEWILLDPEQVKDFDTAVKAMRERLDPGSKVVPGQDFRHTAQKENESVADFIRV